MLALWNPPLIGRGAPLDGRLPASQATVVEFLIKLLSLLLLLLLLLLMMPCVMSFESTGKKLPASLLLHANCTIYPFASRPWILHQLDCRSHNAASIDSFFFNHEEGRGGDDVTFECRRAPEQSLVPDPRRGMQMFRVGLSPVT